MSPKTKDFIERVSESTQFCTAALSLLKVSGIIDFSWIFVLLPFAMPYLIAFSVIAIAIIYVIIINVIIYLYRR